MKKTFLVIGVAVLLAALSLISFYNSLISKTQAIENQRAQVETQYQRRFDLIPNLVESGEKGERQWSFASGGPK